MKQLFIGTDGGVRTLDPDGPGITGHPATALVPGWALTDNKIIWRLDRGGWQQVTGLGNDMQATCLLPLQDGVLVGTAGAHLVRVDGDSQEIVAAFEGVPSRPEWHTPWGGPADIRSLASDDGWIYANVHVGGIVASPDGGRTWAQTALDIDVDVHQVLATGGLVLAAAGAGGLATSTDRGGSWTMTTAGLHASYCRSVALAGDTVLLSASSGPRTERGALYRRGLHEATFDRCRRGLPDWFGGNLDTGRLVADGGVVALAGPDGTVYLSEDAGLSWQVGAEGLGTIKALSF